ncbi:type II 3-dehydroquinate dehydratase [Streptomyces dangxiongensis]|uniref:type II 3-dehydroquinate dehydratase n=1 Tax=Streptomyces dangxiongensis TaxID=1442032 RepID=UPI0030B80929
MRHHCPCSSARIRPVRSASSYCGHAGRSELSRTPLLMLFPTPRSMRMRIASASIVTEVDTACLPWTGCPRGRRYRKTPSAVTPGGVVAIGTLTRWPKRRIPLGTPLCVPLLAVTPRFTRRCRAIKNTSAAVRYRARCALNRLLLFNGPNLGILGSRQPEIHGTDALADYPRPWIEAHFSDVRAREHFRHDSVTGPLAPESDLRPGHRGLPARGPRAAGEGHRQPTGARHRDQDAPVSRGAAPPRRRHGHD